MALDKIRELKAVISELDSALHSVFEETPPAEEAAKILAELNFLKRDLSMVYDACAHALGTLMGGLESIALEDGTVIEKKSAYDRKGWKHSELASAVAGKLTQMAIDMDSGEILKTPEQIAQEMLVYCAPSYWRIKELGKLGINADNYSTVGDLRTSVIVRKPKESF